MTILNTWCTWNYFRFDDELWKLDELKFILLIMGNNFIIIDVRALTINWHLIFT